MRILHLGKYYAPQRGGMETALRLIAEGLLDAGHDVRVLVAGDQACSTTDDLPGAPDALVRAGVAATWQSQPLTLDLVRLLRRELRIHRPDLVHLHTPNPLACAAWLAVARGARRGGRHPRLAVWHHSDIVRQRLAAPLVRPLVRRCLGDADGICVSSAALRDGAAELAGLRDRVAVIPFGIDPAPLATRPRGDGALLFVGRLVRYKGVDVLLDAIADLPAARLDVVGDGPERAALRARAAALGLGDRVRWLGTVDDRRLADLLAGAAALVLPSRDRSETFGLSLLEAMAAGVPVIATDLPTGVRDLCRPGRTGWLVPPADAAALREAIVEVAGDPREARRRGLAGRDLVRASYTRDRLTGDLVAWYAGLLGGTGQAAAGTHGQGRS
jgi:glycosyltransferase involved in cell wall biosynthesis